MDIHIVKKRAEKTDKELLATDFSPSSWVYIVENEGCESSMIIRSAIVEKVSPYYIVYREHGKPLIFHEDEALVFSFKQNYEFWKNKYI